MSRKRNSARVNLVVSVVFHALVVGLLAFWAAREGVLGTRMKEMTAVLVPPEKKPEPPKEPEPPKIEPPKAEELPPPAEPPKAAAVPAPATPPPSAVAEAPAAAPAAASLADFSFGDGAKVVETSTNAPVLYYKNLLEYTLRSNWERPSGMIDDLFVAEVEVQVDPSGRLVGSEWKKKSGNSVWDNSVQAALSKTKSLNRPPPGGFPPRFLVRFDVLPATAEPLTN